MEYKNKSCVRRKTKKDTNAYTKKELADMAHKLFKGRRNSYNKFNKKELCISMISGRPPRKARMVPPVFDRSRPCGPRRTRKNPNAYSKEELIYLATNLLLLPKVMIKKKTVPELCHMIFERDEYELRLDDSCITRSNVELKNHQKLAINQLKRNRGLLVVHGVGSGKTLTGVATTQCLLDRMKTGKAVIVTPKSLQENFKKDMIKYGADPNNTRYEYYTYEELANAIDKGFNPCNDAVLVIDEAHNLRTVIKYNKKGEIVSGRNAYMIIQCAKQAKKVILLTATPVVNKPYDISNLISMVDGTDPLTPSQFNTIMGNPDALENYLRCKVSFFTKSMADPNYPAQIEKDIMIAMPKEFYQKYRKIEKILDKESYGNNPKSFYHGLRKALIGIGADKGIKIEWAIRKIREGGKTLIYTTWVKDGIEKLSEAMNTFNIPFVKVTGDMSKKARKEAVEKYNSGEVKVMMITKAGSEGLDLKETKNVIILGPVWNKAAEDQIKGRAVRYKSHENLPKKDRKVYIYRLYLTKPKLRSPDDILIPSADIVMKNLLESKKNDTSVILEELRLNSIENNPLCRPTGSIRKSIGKSTRKSIGKSTRKSIGKSTRKSIGKSTRKSIGKSTRKSIGKSTRKSIGKSTRKSIGKSTRKSTNFSAIRKKPISYSV